MITKRKIFKFLIAASRRGKHLLCNPYYLSFFLLKKIIWIGVAFFSFISPADALNYEDYPVVKLRSLDKITARTMTFEAKVGSTVRFGEIFIKVQSCRKPPPVEKSEAAAFLQIWQSNEVKETSKWIFSGWMFASSPALSSMDHPVYDVWVLDCLGRDPEPVPVESTSDAVVPPTDGEAPDAVPPSVEPDSPAALQENVTPEDDPGAYEGEAQPIPAETSVPSEPSPIQTPVYEPAQDDPGVYEDDVSPAQTQQPVSPEQSYQPEPVIEEAPVRQEQQQEFQGIY